jgi:gliding motility-associated protein GldC
MQSKDISLRVDLDDNNYPEKIFWKASDDENNQNETKSITLNIWDHHENNTLRIDLWTKEMRVDEMKKFLIDSLGGMAQSILTATGDTFISNELNGLCEKLSKHLQNELQNNPGRQV